MSYIITAGLFIAATLFVVAVFLPPAQASCYSSGSGCTTPPPATTITTTSSNKNTVNPQAVFFGIITVGTTAVCAYKRWWENDPCVGEAKATQTSSADDTITPGNLSDRKDEGAVYIFKGR